MQTPAVPLTPTAAAGRPDSDHGGAGDDPGDIETVDPGEGMPCTVCLLTQAWGTSPAGEPDAGSPDSADAAELAAGGVAYQQWGWPVTLPWPHQVHQVTGVLLLPPTVTLRGPITWTRPPRQDSLQLCREIDLFGAVRTALNDSPPGDPPRRDPPIPR